MSTTHLLDVDAIAKRGDARPLNNDVLAQLEASILVDGLINPIRVRRVGSGYEVVAGHHRLAAHELLGRHQIEAIIVEASDVQAEMAMLAENVIRAELPALERDIQLARWMELSGSGILAQVAPKLSVGRPEGGVRAAARELGINRDDARRAAKVANLSDEARQTAREVGLDDNRTALLKASRAEPARQADVLREHAAHRQGGVAGRYAPTSQPTQTDHTTTWQRFLKVAEEIQAMPIASLISGAGSARAQLSQQVRGVADHMDAVIQEADL